MEFLQRVEGAERFLRMALSFGVVDVRQGGDPPCIYVFVPTGTPDDHVAAVRQLAQVEWPDRLVVLAVRSAVRESGVTRKPTVADGAEVEPPSPRVPKVR